MISVSLLTPIQYLPWEGQNPLPERLIRDISSKLELIDKNISSNDCPYLGLKTFQPEDAHLFFGRYNETVDTLKWLGSQHEHYYRWLRIEGYSGTGTTSLNGYVLQHAKGIKRIIEITA